MAIKIGNEWWTSPTESDSGKLIMVTGRKGVEEAKESGRYNIRVEITWKYPGDKSGMPDTPTATIMEAVQDAMMQTFKKDPVAILTGIYTGDGERNWVFYTKSIHIFEQKINIALAPFVTANKKDVNGSIRNAIHIFFNKSRIRIIRSLELFHVLHCG